MMTNFRRFFMFAVCAIAWLSIAIGMYAAGVQMREAALTASISVTLALAGSAVAAWVAGHED